MGLAITRITLRRFRSYLDAAFDDIGLLTVFVGPNAVGKTNIIEGIQLLTSLSSLRNATAGQLVHWGEKDLFIEAKEKDAYRDLDVSLQTLEGKRLYKVNGKKKAPREVRGILPSVVFSPDDLCLVKGAQSIKRAAIDAIGVQINANYHQIKKDYEKLIRHKNLLLKEGQDPVLLQSVNEMLGVIGAQFQAYRSALFNRMSPFIQGFYQDIAENREDLACSYIPFWEDYDPEAAASYPFTREEGQERFMHEAEARGGEELRRKAALFGPHADKVEFFIDGRNAGAYGSQGQQRSLVLAFKLAEIATIQEITGQQPVLLLDDVMSELDKRRREALLSLLSKDVQTFITTTTLEAFPQKALQQAKVVRLPLGGGAVEGQEGA